MEDFTTFAVFSLSHGRLRSLVLYLSILSVINWVGVLITTIIRSLTGVAYKRQRIDD